MPAELGLNLSSEEHPAADLVANARAAEAAGFSFVSASDHIFPWLDRQGHSPNVWPVLGGVATATERVRIGTGVTCPILRQHPLLVAHAAATVATMAPGRFHLGVGTGERLNEHVLGQHWPAFSVRLQMLEEAVHLIRELWTGELITHRGDFFEVENARIYEAPDDPPPIYVAASGTEAAQLAGRVGDGLISLAPSDELVDEFRKAGGEGKPALAMFHCAVADTEEQGLETARRWWANTGVPGPLNAELALPQHFEAAAEKVTDEQLADEILVGPGVKPHLDTIQRYEDAGFDHIWVHQVGPDQQALIDLYEREILPDR